MSSKKDVFTSHSNTFMTTTANSNEINHFGLNSPRNVHFQSRHPAMSPTVNPPSQRQFVDLETLGGFGGISHDNEMTARMYSQSYGLFNPYYIGFIDQGFANNSNNYNTSNMMMQMDYNSSAMDNPEELSSSSNSGLRYMNDNQCQMDMQSNFTNLSQAAQNALLPNYTQQIQQNNFEHSQQAFQLQTEFSPESQRQQQQQHQLQQLIPNESMIQQEQHHLTNNQQQRIDGGQRYQSWQQHQYNQNNHQQQQQQQQHVDNNFFMDTTSSIFDQLPDIVKEIDSFGEDFNNSPSRSMDEEPSCSFAEALESISTEVNNDTQQLPELTDDDISSGLSNVFETDLQSLEFPEVPSIQAQDAPCIGSNENQPETVCRTPPGHALDRSPSSENTVREKTEEELPKEIFNSDGDTFLHLAIYSQDMAQCLEILDTPVLKKAINTRNASNEVPLLILLGKCLVNCGEVLRKLLNLGVEINVNDKNGNNMFHTCVAEAMSEDQCLNALHVCFEQEKHVEKYKKLLNNRNILGLTPSHLATKKSYRRVIRMFQQHGANLDLTEFQDKKTCMIIAAEANDWITVTELIDLKADVNKETKASQRPINFAIRTGHADMIKLLFEHGTEVHKWKDMVPSKEIEDLVWKLIRKKRRKKKMERNE